MSCFAPLSDWLMARAGVQAKAAPSNIVEKCKLIFIYMKIPVLAGELAEEEQKARQSFDCETEVSS
jgi:hypothetical protein